jgi:hypothetical protein
LSIARNINVCSHRKSSPKRVLGTLNIPPVFISGREYCCTKISSLKNSSLVIALSELYLISNGYFARGYTQPSLKEAETIILESPGLGRTQISSLTSPKIFSVPEKYAIQASDFIHPYTEESQSLS